jgi:hypothetical protein
VTAAIMVLSGVFSGPLCAFLLGYPAFLATGVFVPIGAFRLGGKWLARLLLLALAPAAIAAYGAAVGDTGLLRGALRWCTALASGMYFAGELDTSVLLRGLGKRRSGVAGRFLGDLALVMSMAGPAAARARETFSRSRKRGTGLAGCVEESVLSLSEPFERPECRTKAGSAFPVTAALLTWMLMLWAVSGLGGPPWTG